jgi:four helix bundle protein
MARTRFEELRVYRLAENLSDRIWFIVLKWPRFAQDTVGKQIVRASDSIGANIAEGDGRGSFMDSRRFTRMARGSLQESQHWLRRAFQRHLLKDSEVQELRALLDELGPTLNAYLRSITKLIDGSRKLGGAPGPAGAKSKEQRAKSQQQ